MISYRFSKWSLSVDVFYLLGTKFSPWEGGRGGKEVEGLFMFLFIFQSMELTNYFYFCHWMVVSLSVQYVSSREKPGKLASSSLLKTN